MCEYSRAEKVKPFHQLGVHVEELEWRRFFGNVASIIEGSVSCSTNNVAEKSDLNIVLLVSNMLRLRTFSSLSSSDAICQVETNTNISAFSLSTYTVELFNHNCHEQNKLWFLGMKNVFSDNNTSHLSVNWFTGFQISKLSWNVISCYLKCRIATTLHPDW